MFDPGYNLILEACTQFASLEKIVIDGKILDSEFFQEQMPPAPKKIEYALAIHASSISTFHANADEFLNAGSGLSRGVLPSEYYIVENDCYSEDYPAHEIVCSIQTACSAINLLAKIAHYHDGKSDTGCLQLVFICPGENKLPTYVLHTKITSLVLLSFNSFNLELLESLASSDGSTDPHLATRKGVFYSTLSEFLSGVSEADDHFVYLISNWNSFSEIYQKNLNTYFSGFAFHKAKQEVARTELELASQLSKVVGDITGKMLAVPLSFAAIIAVSKSDLFLEKLAILLGLVVTSLIVSAVISNQRRHLLRISHGKSIAFKAIDGNKGTYPAELILDIEKMKSGLNSDQCQLGKTLCFLKIIAWIPTILAIFVIIFQEDALVDDAARFLFSVIKKFGCNVMG